MTKQIVYVDMDDTIVDFKSGIDAVKNQYPEKDPESHDDDWDEVYGIFAHMKPIDGAIEAVRELGLYYEVHILTTAPWKNPTAWSDKLEWIKRHFGATEAGKLLYKNLTVSHNKDLLGGSYLIDDRPHNGALEFGHHEGQTWIQIGDKDSCEKSEVRLSTWPQVLDWLASERKKIAKSKKCPLCGGKLLEIVYGMPAFDDMSEDVIYAGCIVDVVNPEVGCKCGYELPPQLTERQRFAILNGLPEILY